MAIKNRCVACDHVIEAEDAMRGRELACPRCGVPNVLRSATDAALMTDPRVEAERRRFLERLSGSGSGGGRRPGAEPALAPPPPGAWAPPEDAGRGMAVLAGRRLKDVSIYVLGLAYGILALTFVLAGLLVWQAPVAPVWKAFAFLATSLAGVVVFVILKLSSDSVRALADVTDLLRSIDVRLERVEEAQDRQEVVPAAAPPEPAPAERSVG